MFFFIDNYFSPSWPVESSLCFRAILIGLSVNVLQGIISLSKWFYFPVYELRLALKIDFRHFYHDFYL